MSNKESTEVVYTVEIPEQFSAKEMTDRYSFLVWLEKAFSLGNIRFKESSDESEEKAEARKVG